jgi:ferritin
MISKKLQDAINSQINYELYSSYLYLAMGAHLETKNLKGMASWMQVQAQEEIFHAMKFFNYLNERDGQVILEAIDQPPKEWSSPQAAFEDAYGHEQKVTTRINNLMSLAIEEKDYASQSFLQWYIDEQVEEEASVSEIADKLEMIGNNSNGLFMLDKELGQRTYTPPASAE